MSLWDGILGRKSVKLTDTSGWFLDGGSHAGKPVTPDTTLSLSAAWKCVRLRSRVLGSLPMDVHERLADGGSRRAKNHWLYTLVHESPNADQSAAEFWGGMVACIDLWGNAYAEKVRSGPRIVALRPLRPDATRPYRTTAGERRYRTSDPVASAKDLSEADVLHLRGFTLGGDVGLSAVSYGRHTMGLALAAEETASKTFANGLQVAGFIKLVAGTKLTTDQRNELVDLFAKFSGSSKAGKIMPLDPGMEFAPLSFTPEDAQLLESRGFNVEEICRWFDVPPILVGHAGKGQTMWGSGVEQIMLGWLTLDLNPFLKGIEQAVAKQLLSPAERLTFYPEYNREALLEADSTAKAALMQSLTMNGLMTRNEGRAKLNLPKDKSTNADALTVQSALVTLDQLGQAPAASTAKDALRAWLADDQGDAS